MLVSFFHLQIIEPGHHNALMMRLGSRFHTDEYFDSLDCQQNPMIKIQPSHRQQQLLEFPQQLVDGAHEIIDEVEDLGA